MAMTPDELKTANDFETGWSEERLDATEFHWGTGITDILPHPQGEQIIARVKEKVFEKRFREIIASLDGH